MKELLKKLKLIDHLSTELPISKYLFVERLSAIVDKKDTGLFSDMFDTLSSSKNHYKGTVGNDDFKIKRRKRFFDTTMNLAIAKGDLLENNGHVRIETEINGFSNLMILIFVFIALTYTITLILISQSDDNFNVFPLIFILIHGSLMLCIPYFVMKRNVQNLKYDLEREFFYLTKHDNHQKN
jgi:hypothetical protein